MSVALLERAAAALGPLVDEVVFVGGATIALWITDPAAPPPRPTVDVDVIVEAASRLEYHAFEERLRSSGFREDQEDGVICRWSHAETGLRLDAMPAKGGILGFENRWQRKALPHAGDRTLPNGAVIRAVPPPYLLATKLEAFAGRGHGDFLASEDFADVIALIDGRAEIVAEVRDAPREVRVYLADELGRLSVDRRFADGVFGALRPDAASQDRGSVVVEPRIEAIIAAR